MTATTGLVPGRFAPLHKGHQHLIETALAETEHVLVLVSDCPELTPVPLGVRARWIRELYPAVEVREAWDGPRAPGEDAPPAGDEARLLRRLAGRRITHVYSGDERGAALARRLGAIDRRVDPQRRHYPVASAQLRADPYGQRHWLHPRVYRDLVANVVFLGAPCTGKSTLAQRLAEEFATVWMPEHGRRYWAEHQVDRRLTPAELTELAEQHLAREDERLAQAHRFLFTDTNALSTYCFALYYHARAGARLAELAAQAAARYDLTFVCDTDVPFEATADRSGVASRAALQRILVSELRARRIPYLTLRGALEERLAKVRRLLLGFEKYANLPELLGACGTPGAGGG